MENFLLNRDVNFVEKNMVIEYGDKKIKFCNNILQVIQKYVQSERKSCEAGGILIGRENCGNSNLIIEFITEPMTADQRSRNRFLRKDKRHLDFFKKLYEENEGVYGYMGEWHTHPENIPQYSFIDSNNWKKIGKEMKGGIQYHIIAGIQEVGIWEYNAVQKRITKICSIDWKGILKENQTII